MRLPPFSYGVLFGMGLSLMFIGIFSDSIIAAVLGVVGAMAGVVMVLHEAGTITVPGADDIWEQDDDKL